MLQEEVFYSLVILFLISLFISNWNITGFEDRHHQGKHNINGKITSQRNVHLWYAIKLRLVGHLNRKTIIKTNIAFSSWLFTVKVQLNLQSKKIKTSKFNYVAIHTQNLFVIRWKCSLKWSNYPRETEPNKKKKERLFCLQITTA